MGAALTNASEVELSCGHGDVLIGLIVRDQDLWRQFPAPMGILEDKKQEQDLGRVPEAGLLTLVSHHDDISS